MMNEQWVLLWSRERNTADVRPLAQFLSEGRIAYRDDEALGDWRPLMIGEKPDMEAAGLAMAPTLHKRGAAGAN